MHILDLPRMVFEAVATGIVEGDESPTRRMAAGVTEEEFDLKWMIEFSPAELEPAQASVRAYEDEEIEVFSFGVLLVPYWDEGMTTIVDFDQGFWYTSHYEGVSDEVIARYFELAARLMAAITQLSQQQGWPLKDGRQTELGMEVQVPPRAFEYNR